MRDAAPIRIHGAGHAPGEAACALALTRVPLPPPADHGIVTAAHRETARRRRADHELQGESAMKVKLLLGCVVGLPLFAWGASASKDLAQVLAGKPDASHGAKLFEQCVACHGTDGGGTVNGSVPRIAGQHYRVLARQIVDFRHGKRWDMRMEGVATSHSILPELPDITDV